MNHTNCLAINYNFGNNISYVTPKKKKTAFARCTLTSKWITFKSSWHITIGGHLEESVQINSPWPKKNRPSKFVRCPYQTHTGHQYLYETCPTCLYTLGPCWILRIQKVMSWLQKAFKITCHAPWSHALLFLKNLKGSFATK